MFERLPAAHIQPSSDFALAVHISVASDEQELACQQRRWQRMRMRRVGPEVHQ